MVDKAFRGTARSARAAQCVERASDAPFEAFLGQYVPHFTLELVSLAIAVAIFNACLAGFIGIGSMVFAMGRTNLFAGPINHALTRQIGKSRAPWVAICAVGASAALATFVPLYVKLLLLSGSTAIISGFQVWGVLAGRRAGKTGRTTYRTPLFPAIPLLGIVIAIGEGLVLWLDAEVGRKSLLICAAVYLLAFCYYRFVLMRREEGWVMSGPAEVDAAVGVDQDSPVVPATGQAVAV